MLEGTTAQTCKKNGNCGKQPKPKRSRKGFVLVPTSLSDEQYNQLEEVMQDNFGTTVPQSRDCITKIHDELVSIAQHPSSTPDCPDEP